MILDGADKLALEARATHGYLNCWDDLDKDLALAADLDKGNEPDFLCAWNEGLSVGCAAIVELNEDECEIRYLYVRQGLRGHRIGSNLCQYALSTASRAHYSRVSAHVPVIAAHALNIFARLRFELIAEGEEMVTLARAIYPFPRGHIVI